ncbi:hypothetical protein H4582DRAFT_2061010 [Lactarius indigo]|nr:hypothetical protein H4582DRAFT_2061010 [Lactarius indigo]
MPSDFQYPPVPPEFANMFNDTLDRAIASGRVPADSPSSPPTSPSDKQGIDYILECFNCIDPDVTRVNLMAELIDILNAPAGQLEGLSPLHWLGLNPLVRLGAPLGHLGPSPPPPPFPLEDVRLAVSNIMDETLLPSLALLLKGSNTTTRALEAFNQRLDSIEAHIHSSPPAPVPVLEAPPLSPPVVPPQDVEMEPTPTPLPPPAPPVSKPRALQPSAQTPTPAPAKAKPAPVPAPVKPSRPTKPSFATMAKSPARPSLVVSLRPPTEGTTNPPAVRRTPQEIVTHLNAVLHSEGHAVSLSAARWTARNNLVVTAGPDTTAHHLTSSSHLISDSLATFLSADSSPLPVLARENCKWSRLLVNGIPTGASPTRGPYTPSELHAALLADNPACRGLRFTQAPSWVRAPSTYKPGSVSSMVLTFEDPSGDSLRSLLADKVLFAFGHIGELKRWKAKPRSKATAPLAASS